MKHLKLFEAFNNINKIEIVSIILAKYLINKEVPVIIPKIFDKIDLKCIKKNDIISYYIQKKELRVKSYVIQDKFWDLFVYLYDHEDLEMEYREIPIINVMKADKKEDSLEIFGPFYDFINEMLIDVMFTHHGKYLGKLYNYPGRIFNEAVYILRDTIKLNIANMLSIDAKRVKFVSPGHYLNKNEIPFVAEKDVEKIKMKLQNSGSWKY